MVAYKRLSFSPHDLSEIYLVDLVLSITLSIVKLKGLISLADEKLWSYVGGKLETSV